MKVARVPLRALLLTASTLSHAAAESTRKNTNAAHKHRGCPATAAPQSSAHLPVGQLQLPVVPVLAHVALKDFRGVAELDDKQAAGAQRPVRGGERLQRVVVRQHVLERAEHAGCEVGPLALLRGHPSGLAGRVEA